jgi:hypothetical protein
MLEPVKKGARWLWLTLLTLVPAFIVWVLDNLAADWVIARLKQALAFFGGPGAIVTAVFSWVAGHPVYSFLIAASTIILVLELRGAVRNNTDRDEAPPKVDRQEASPERPRQRDDSFNVIEEGQRRRHLSDLVSSTVSPAGYALYHLVETILKRFETPPLSEQPATRVILPLARPALQVYYSLNVLYSAAIPDSGGEQLVSSEVITTLNAFLADYHRSRTFVVSCYGYIDGIQDWPEHVKWIQADSKLRDELRTAVHIYGADKLKYPS